MEPLTKADGVELYRSRYQQLRQTIATACAANGRSPDEVRVVAVTKYVGPERIEWLLEAGLTDFGENRWQQAREKVALPQAAQATWHFIGRLQKNKVKAVVQHFAWIHSIDSVELGELINRYATESGRVVDGLLQVNVSGEASKAGLEPEAALAAAKRLHGLPGLRLRGLMTMAPMTDDAEAVRPVFAGLRALRDDIREALSDPLFCELSMGMSDDFPVAIAEGATMVRIGRRLVG